MGLVIKYFFALCSMVCCAPNIHAFSMKTEEHEFDYITQYTAQGANFKLNPLLSPSTDAHPYKKKAPDSIMRMAELFKYRPQDILSQKISLSGEIYTVTSDYEPAPGMRSITMQRRGYTFLDGNSSNWLWQTYATRILERRANLKQPAPSGTCAV